jgi:glucan phosphorylase
MYGYSKTWQEELFAKINPAALTIGFARRFAPYKRADMILSDLDRLDRRERGEHQQSEPRLHLSVLHT